MNQNPSGVKIPGNMPEVPNQVETPSVSADTLVPSVEGQPPVPENPVPSPNNEPIQAAVVASKPTAIPPQPTLSDEQKAHRLAALSSAEIGNIQTAAGLSEEIGNLQED